MSNEDKLAKFAEMFLSLPSWGREQLLQRLADSGDTELLPILIQAHRDIETE